MKNSKTLSEKLKSYSLFAGSILASSLAARGQVIYTNPADVELGGAPPPTIPYDAIDSIDLNNDGTFDFNISIKFSDTFAGGYSFTEKVRGLGASNIVLPYTINYVPFMHKAHASDSIPFAYYQYGFHFGFFAYQNANSANYIWNNVTDGYIGLKFFVGTDAHWAWVRLDVNTNDSIPNIIIKDYAYETIPDKKIHVGDIGVGIEAPPFENQNQFSIFPNPSTGKSVIKLNQPFTGDLELRVTDVLGKEVYKSDLQVNSRQTELPFDLSHLTPGIYFIQLNSETISISQKWIKK